ncbi:10106_t:CDS:10, partial [Diversispora eburnea]
LKNMASTSFSTSSSSSDISSVPPKRLNRLSNEKSPYLQQHANNPVDWYPWGEEAFQKAKKENKLIFLSVGYSTCHWCHVMAHESFENESVAKVMNENFVNVKEVQPDVDSMYMLFVQSTTGGGGWPMSVFLTLSLVGHIFHQLINLEGKPGFTTLCKRLADIWKEQPDKLKQSGVETIEQLRKYTSGTDYDVSDLNMGIAQMLYRHFVDSFDDEQGGFDGKSMREPKFPTPVQFHFLLRHHYYTLSDIVKDDRIVIMPVQEIRNLGTTKLGIDFKDCTGEAEIVKKFQNVIEIRKQAAERDLNMVEITLKKIAMGGIHDHIGNGFHRYSTDRFWHVPHFEKMLYDQAQLLMSYIEVYLITKDEYYAENARDIIKYVERDLGNSEGGFFSAEDADSYSHEGAKYKLGEVLFQGAFCVWEESEIKEILNDQKKSEILCWHFGVKKDGNVDPRKDIQGELKKKNVLIQRYTLEETSRHFEITLNELKEILEESKQKLAKFRFENRPKPHRDDKILTSWNGLMISGLSQAYNALRDEKIRDLAENAAKFIKSNLYDKEKNILLRSFKEGPGNVQGFVDDYSFLIGGLLDLYESTFNESYLTWAIDLQDKQNQLFYDEKVGGYFNVGEGVKDILIRMKDANKPDYIQKAEQTLKYFSGRLTKTPFTMPELVSDSTVQQFLDVIRSKFIPNKVVLLAKSKDGVLSEKNEMVKSLLQSEIGGTPSIHICENFTCGLPITDIQELEKKLES